MVEKKRIIKPTLDTTEVKATRSVYSLRRELIVDAN